MNVKDFIKSIREEENNFKFGKSWRYSKASLVAVLPILREDKSKRNYETLAEAKKVKVEDTGMINFIYVENNGKKPVFIRAGEIFKGKTQERACVVSRIVMPDTTEKIKVVCVHASEGINTNANMKSTGYAANSVENTILRTQGSQYAVWESVQTYSARVSNSNDPSVNRSGSLNDAAGFRGQSVSSDPSDDLVKNAEKFSKTIEEVLRSVPKQDNQVGAVLIGLQGVEMIEVFDLEDSWTAIRDNVIKKEGENISKEDKDNPFEYKALKAKKAAKNALTEKRSTKDLHKDKQTQTVSIDTKNFVGEAAILHDEVIHLMLVKKIL